MIGIRRPSLWRLLEAEHHDVHARLYLDGNCYEPDLSLLWPIEPVLAGMLPATMHHELARHQMGIASVISLASVGTSLRAHGGTASIRPNIFRTSLNA